MTVDFSQRPYMVQFNYRSFAGDEGECVVVDLKNAKITKYKTKDRQTDIKSCSISDIKMQEMCDFFDYEKIEKFNNMTDEELKNCEISYYHSYIIEYHSFSKDRSDKQGSWITVYSENPFQNLLFWATNILHADR